VLLALQGRRVEVSQMRAVGYGESRPIADNDSEEGREANRRIEIALIGAPAAPAATAPETAAAPATTSTATTSTADAAPQAAATLAAPLPPEDAAACVANITALLARDKITFDPGSDDISSASEGLISALAELLQQCPGKPIEVAGHTDSQGTSRNNLTLSEDRAKAVLVALKERGVDVATMKAVGYGEDRPIADNGTEEGREANRRIEFTLIGAPPPYPPPPPPPPRHPCPGSHPRPGGTGRSPRHPGPGRCLSDTRRRPRFLERHQPLHRPAGKDLASGGAPRE
jgi:OOP family OmpA-OmpF porin